MRFGVERFGALQVLRLERNQRGNRRTVPVALGVTAHRGGGIALQRVFDRADPRRVQQGRRMIGQTDARTPVFDLRETLSLFAEISLSTNVGLNRADYRQGPSRRHSANRYSRAANDNIALFLVRHSHPPTLELPLEPTH